MFEFEDDDFTLLGSFSLADSDNGSADFEDLVLTCGNYLGDGVWVVDLQENLEAVEPVQAPVSET